MWRKKRKISETRLRAGLAGEEDFDLEASATFFFFFFVINIIQKKKKKKSLLINYT
jgi:hypothetical protein